MFFRQTRRSFPAESMLDLVAWNGFGPMAITLMVSHKQNQHPRSQDSQLLLTLLDSIGY